MDHTRLSEKPLLYGLGHITPLTSTVVILHFSSSETMFGSFFITHPAISVPARQFITALAGAIAVR